MGFLSEEKKHKARRERHASPADDANASSGAAVPGCRESQIMRRRDSDDRIAVRPGKEHGTWGQR